MNQQLLSETELDRLGEFLDSLAGPHAMNLEQLDGFFCALIAGPEVVMPSEYWPVVIDQDPEDEASAPSFESLEHAQEIMDLVQRHWNGIATTLNAGDIYAPLLMHDDDDVARGNEWARGFLQGVQLRHSSWQEFINDEEEAGAIIPMFALAHEDDPDPELRVESPPPEKRMELLTLMTAGLAHIHRYFAAARDFQVPTEPFVRTTPKVGRNDPCPCGSGKKYKRCCQRQTN